MEGDFSTDGKFILAPPWWVIVIIIFLCLFMGLVKGVLRLWKRQPTICARPGSEGWLLHKRMFDTNFASTVVLEIAQFFGKGGYTATPVAFGWAGAIIETTKTFA